MNGQTRTTVGLIGLLALLLFAAPGVAQNREPDRPLLMRVPAAERAEILLPAFCRSDPGEPRAQQGHPKFGVDWCRLLAVEGPGEEGIDAEMLKVEALLQCGTPFQPFCRQGGGGHPQFGFSWCQGKTQALLSAQAFGGPAAAPPAPADDVAPFCRPGGAGHPKWGMEWCGWSEEERNRRGGVGGDGRR